MWDRSSAAAGNTAAAVGTAGPRKEIAEILSTPALPLAVGAADAVSEHALLLLPQLRLLSNMRKQVAERMEALLLEMSSCEADVPETRFFRDIAVLRSLPASGEL